MACPAAGVCRGLKTAILDRLIQVALEADQGSSSARLGWRGALTRPQLWALAAVACALLALAFFIVSLVVALWDTHRLLGVLSGAGLFAVLTAICAFFASRTFKGKPAMLEGTLSQLQTDADRASENP